MGHPSIDLQFKVSTDCTEFVANGHETAQFHLVTHYCRSQSIGLQVFILELMLGSELPFGIPEDLVKVINRFFVPLSMG